MTETQIRENLSKNLTALRKAQGLTQTELGEKLTYSDKSVSKWERGDGLPDIVTLEKLAELFGVTVDALIGAAPPETQPPVRMRRVPSRSKRIIIPLLSAGLVFLVASVLYLAVTALQLPFAHPARIFLYAVPAACIPLIVFMKLWWGVPQRFCAVSALVWTLALSLWVAFGAARMHGIFIVAAVMQTLVILWYIMRAISRRKRRLAMAAKENEGGQ
ncbi:MAG: helix-turn-helix transcriptional regulator [Clostridia bacterium]|nr:helix-turn-helix transcriptional regulator [Clostridia bacterium]